MLAIKDVYPQLLKYMRQVDEDPENISISGKIGISWGHSGGEAGGLFTESYLAADGIENVIRGPGGYGGSEVYQSENLWSWMPAAAAVWAVC